MWPLAGARQPPLVRESTIRCTADPRCRAIVSVASESIGDCSDGIPLPLLSELRNSRELPPDSSPGLFLPRCRLASPSCFGQPLLG